LVKIFRYKKVISTNTLAKQLLLKEKGNFIVVAKQQSGGRGQRGKNWYSPPGGLYFSLVLRPVQSPLKFSDFPCQVTKVLKKVIEKLFNVSVQIKKPNDLLIQGKKIAGILVESATRCKKIRHLIVGIGVNLEIDFSATVLAEVAASLADFSRQKRSGFRFLQEFFKQFQADFPALFI
jgi:BirA family biotin operon repressor/biotin-[acetyl-CoA-carboxylase] ligase